MSRRKSSAKRDVIPDPVYKDATVAKFINMMMIQGKKAVAQSIIYSAFDNLKDKVPGEEPLSIFKKALENVKPALEVRSRRVGGATYQVPMDVRPVRKTTLAMRWLVDFSRERGEKDMSLRLAAEIVDAFNNRGNAIKKREDVHRMAEANKAFAHYKW
jgi:small subunit ribosomal protein S7